MSRPELFKLLMSYVPKSKILLQKAVVDVAETDFGVLCRCSDGSEYWSDMVVGADGAYSKVRERMYHGLQMEGRLPLEDAEPLKLTHLCVLGVSTPLDPKVFSTVEQRFSEFELVLMRKRSLSIWLSPIGGNKISWCYGGEIEPGSHNLMEGLDGYWGKGSTNTLQILEEINDVPTVYGCKVGDIIKTTPKDLVSSVLLEEKFFETWHSKRIVLLGDGK
ncbi:hypothetical protein BX616_008566 [Lobosporangium transversale]|nr:hypothetical protein BX616_008566 [Lobosporangium transversale]